MIKISYTYKKKNVFIEIEKRHKSPISRILLIHSEIEQELQI